MGVAIPIAALVVAAVGTAVSAVGTAQQASAQKNAANYQAQVAANQQQIASEQARQASAAGQQQAYNQGLRNRAIVGGIEAAQAAGNVDVNTGSAVDVRSSAAALGQLNALTIRSNAARQAYGFETQATSYGAQQGLEQQLAGQAGTAGTFGTIGSLASGASSVAQQYQQWRMVGAFDGGGGNPGAIGGNVVFG